MNYERLYSKLITKAQHESRTSDSSKYENHHILPKSIGGNDDFSNLVLLTFREHYIAHYMLTKIYPESKELHYAFWAMNNQTSGSNTNRTYKVNSRLFEASRKNISILMKGNKHSLGHKHSEETKKLMSQQTSGIHHHSFKGYYITPWGKFESSKQAAIETLSDVTINKWCKKSKEIILSKARYDQNQSIFDKDDIGKSLFELGFAFEQSERIIPEKKNKEIIPENHSQFKGYYITPWGKYTSVSKCKEETGYRVREWCKESYKEITKVSVRNFPELFLESDIGKTFKDKGFGFEEV